MFRKLYVVATEKPQMLISRNRSQICRLKIPQSAKVLESLHVGDGKGTEKPLSKFHRFWEREKIQIPANLVLAAKNLVEKYPIKDLSEKAEKLRKYVWSRQAPSEQEAIKQRLAEIEGSLTEKMASNSPEGESLSPDKLERLQQTIRQQTLRILKYETYHWKEIKMDAFMGIVYMVGHLFPHYSVLHKILYEIHSLDPNFKPFSLLDFGSGLAVSVWTAHEIWPDIKEFLCLDRSADMCNVARLLLQDGEENKEMRISGVYFRQQLEKRDSHPAGYDLVICAHTLFEFPDRKSRLAKLEALWKQTSGYLVLVENGTINGHRLIEEARLHILQKFNDETEHRGFVFSPCPHNLPCPKILSNSRIPCNFEAEYNIGDVDIPEVYKQLFCPSKSNSAKSGMSTRSQQSVRYSYVVLKKGQLQQNDKPLPRLVQEPKKLTKNCVQCLTCFPDGRLKLAVFTNSNKEVFKVAKKSSWGSILPIEGFETEIQEDTTSEEDGMGDESKMKDLKGPEPPFS